MLDEHGRQTPFGLMLGFPGFPPDICLNCIGTGERLELCGNPYDPRMEFWKCVECDGNGFIY